MFAKVVFVVCASALVIQSAFGQYRMAAPVAPCHAGLAYNGLGQEGAWLKGTGCGAFTPAAELAASHGRGLAVSSSSCTAPTGLAVASENAYEGCVGVTGNLPFLGTAAMEGVFPTAGASAVSYGCGDGVVAITAEGPTDAAFAPMGVTPAAIVPASIAPAAASWGYNGLPARGCGCGSYVI